MTKKTKTKTKTTKKGKNGNVSQKQTVNVKININSKNKGTEDKDKEKKTSEKQQAVADLQTALSAFNTAKSKAQAQGIKIPADILNIKESESDVKSVQEIKTLTAELIRRTQSINKLVDGNGYKSHFMPPNVSGGMPLVAGSFSPSPVYQGVPSPGSGYNPVPRPPTSTTGTQVNPNTSTTGTGTTDSNTQTNDELQEYEEFLKKLYDNAITQPTKQEQKMSLLEAQMKMTKSAPGNPNDPNYKPKKNILAKYLVDIQNKLIELQTGNAPSTPTGSGTQTCANAPGLRSQLKDAFANSNTKEGLTAFIKEMEINMTTPAGTPCKNIFEEWIQKAEQKLTELLAQQGSPPVDAPTDLCPNAEQIANTADARINAANQGNDYDRKNKLENFMQILQEQKNKEPNVECQNIYTDKINVIQSILDSISSDSGDDNPGFDSSNPQHVKLLKARNKAIFDSLKTNTNDAFNAARANITEIDREIGKPNIVFDSNVSFIILGKDKMKKLVKKVNEDNNLNIPIVENKNENAQNLLKYWYSVHLPDAIEGQ